MLEIIKANFNIMLNGPVGMKTESGMMRPDLTILPKLSKIITLVILINPGLENLRLIKMREKEVDNQDLSFIIC